MTNLMFLIVNENYEYAESTLTGGTVDYSGYLINGTGPNLSIEDYIKVKGIKNWEVLTWDEFYPKHKEAMAAKYLHSAIAITEEEYDDALNCLPPMQWIQNGVFETFMMSEYLTGDITAQYGKKGEKYICKNISVGNKSTYIDLPDFEV